ncbi:MAG: hypothetical protein HC860_03760 [Alkalinema sp. RU_4_3]|nr:hypothetical protein [Alkalinema sp. RU_4_3]
MKFNSTVVYTFVLLFLMIGAGVASAVSGFSMGREALKGITQPDSRPNKGKANRTGVVAKEDLQLLKEDDIVKSMKERIDSSAKNGAKAPEKPEKSEKEKTSEKPKAEKNAKVELPVTAESEGVAMEVLSRRQEGDSTLFEVAMKNSSDRPVSFRYNFMNITDNKGQIVNAEAIGLPEALPAKSEKFSGSVKIATGSLEKVENVTLQLSDYPEQKIQLRLTDIPAH